MRQFIPRKRHPTGIKLCCPVDAQALYASHVYLYYCAAKKNVDIEENRYARHMQPAQVVQLWSDVMPSDSVLVADTCFGSHEVAATLPDQKRPFLILTRRSELGVEEASPGWGQA